MRRPKVRTATLMLMLPILLPAPRARAEDLKLGILTDLSSIYADVSGKDSIEAAEIAVTDMAAQLGPWTVEIVSADHLGKADVGGAIARQWLDEGGVDVIAGIPNSSVALAVQDLARQRQKIVLITGAATVDLTGKSCSPFTAHWTDDTFSLSSGAVRAAGGGEAHLLLHRRRLRLWHLHPGRGKPGHFGGAWPSGGLGAPPDRHAGLLLLSPAGPGLARRRHRAGQWRRGHDQRG